MEERGRFIADWLRGGAPNLAALCRLYEISRKTGYKWVERFEAAGLAGLEDRSRAAHRQPRRIAVDIEKRLIAARRRHPTWGPKKLRAWLPEREPETAWPAASTIGEALKRAGLVRPCKRVRRLVEAPAGPLREPAESNDVWTLDHKGRFRTGDGAACYPLTVVDGYSRFLLACEAHGGTSYEASRGSLERLFRERGLPRRVRSDNGSPFASTGAGRLSRLNVWWLKLEIEVERIEPGKPQQNGRHERLHRTLKAETARPPTQNRRAQQRRFDRFRAEYNEQRPHEALGQTPPAATREYPRKLTDSGYPGYWERRRVRHDRRVKLGGRQYFLNEALRGELLGLVEVDEALWQVLFGPAEIALVDTAGGELWPPRLYCYPSARFGVLPIRPVVHSRRLSHSKIISAAKRCSALNM